MSESVPSTWEKLAAVRRTGSCGKLLRDWWVVLVWSRRLGSWLAYLVNPDAVIVRTTEDRAARARHRAPETAYRAAARWFQKTGALPGWVSERSARRAGWGGPIGAVGLLDDRGRWTGAR